MKLILLILTTVYLQADVSNYTCTPEQIEKVHKEVEKSKSTVYFNERYEDAVRKYCSIGWRDLIVWGVKEK